jgi:hypothetical protein
LSEYEGLSHMLLARAGLARAGLSHVAEARARLSQEIEARAGLRHVTEAEARAGTAWLLESKSTLWARRHCFRTRANAVNMRRP